MILGDDHRERPAVCIAQPQSRGIIQSMYVYMYRVEIFSPLLIFYDSWVEELRILIIFICTVYARILEYYVCIYTPLSV